MEPAGARPGQALINSARKTQQEFEEIFKSRGGFPQVWQLYKLGCQTESASKPDKYSYDPLPCRCRSISPRGTRRVLHQHLRMRSHRSSNFRDLLRRLAGIHHQIKGCADLAQCSQEQICCTSVTLWTLTFLAGNVHVFTARQVSQSKACCSSPAYACPNCLTSFKVF